MKTIISIGLIGLIMTGCNFDSDDNKIENKNFQKSKIENNLSFDEQEELLNSKKESPIVKEDSNNSKKVVDKNETQENSFSFDKKDINTLSENFTKGSAELVNDISTKASEYSENIMEATKAAASTALTATKQGLSNGATWSKNYAKNWFAETWEESKREHARQKEARKNAAAQKQIK